MKILLISAVDSPHTQQWVTGLVKEGLEIGIFSLRMEELGWTKAFPQVTVLYARTPTYFPALGVLNNINLFTYSPAIRKAIRAYQPDLVHAHNLGNHGLIAALAGAQPLLLSAWGSDIFTHPHRSWFHRYWTGYTLRHGKRILATSKVLAAETAKYCEQKVELTPFGIDLERFAPRQKKHRFGEGKLIIGSVKGLESVYNHPWTLRCFAQLCERLPDWPLELVLVGKGSQAQMLQALAKELNIADKVRFTGLIPYAEIPEILAEIDIFVNVSKRESFGVAVLEASAMELPVIATNVEGLPEVVEAGKTGFLISPGEDQEFLTVLEQLVRQKDLRREMGRAGRAFVVQHYEKNACIRRMVDIYRNTLSQH